MGASFSQLREENLNVWKEGKLEWTLFVNSKLELPVLTQDFQYI